MLTVQNVSPGQAGSYYKADDYYTAGAPPSHWLGKGAEALGLSGEVREQDLADALRGHLPGGVDLNNSSVEQRRAATDFTLSAPKSVSIAALVEGDHRVLDAHNSAVKCAVARMESYVQVRTTSHSVTRSEHTGNVVVAAVRHDTSRAGDPQVHTHCLMVNATQRADGEWRSIENRDIVRHQKEVDALYKVELAGELKRLGYAIQPTQDGFELAHISREQIREFSRRSEQIEKTLAAKGLDRDSASAEQKQHATLATRDKKQIYDRAELLREWRERARPFDGGRAEEAARLNQQIQLHNRECSHDIERRRRIGAERADQHRLEPLRGRGRHSQGLEVGRAAQGQRLPDLRQRDAGAERPGATGAVLPGAAPGSGSRDHCVHHLDRAPAGERLTARDLVSHAKAHCTERESIARMQDIRAEAYRAAIGTDVSIRQIDRELARQERTRELIVERKSDGREFATTADAQRTEARILAVEQRGRHSVEAVVSPDTARDLADRHRLSIEQGNALYSALSTTHQVVGIEGRAGTGKTTTLTALREGAEAAGYKLVGVAPSHSAVKAMGEAGIDARTVQGWIGDRQAGRQLDARSLLVVDEAGLVGSKHLAAALERAQRAGARVVLVGDTRQYQAVEAGRPLALLRERGMVTAEIATMRRQDNARPEVRLAAQLSSDRTAARESLAVLDKAGRVVEIADAGARRAQIARDFAAMPVAQRQQTLVLTGTNDARREINDRIRTELRLAGTGREVATFVRGDQTAAETKLVAAYEPGDLVRFEKDYRSLDAKAGDIWRVTDTKLDRVVLEKDGQRIELQPARIGAKGITLGREESRELSSGDRIRFTGTDREAGFANGDRGTVHKIDSHRITVLLDGGKTVEVDHRRQPVAVDHGYAATGHSAQGLGAMRTLIDKDTASLTTDHRSFYTDLTRTKSDTLVYTDNKERLAERVSEAREKTNALDLGRTPGLERDMPALTLELERADGAMTTQELRDRAMEEAAIHRYDHLPAGRPPVVSGFER